MFDRKKACDSGFVFPLIICLLVFLACREKRVLQLKFAALSSGRHTLLTGLVEVLE